jgi:hypothetical protein
MYGQVTCRVCHTAAPDQAVLTVAAQNGIELLGPIPDERANADELV